MGLIVPSRRSFLFGATTAAALLATPAIIQVANLMPVRSLPLLSQGELNDRFMANLRGLLVERHGADDVAQAVMSWRPKQVA